MTSCDKEIYSHMKTEAGVSLAAWERENSIMLLQNV
jgi:hypothetical protein